MKVHTVQKENVGVMASLPYPDPFEGDDLSFPRNPSLRRGRTVRVRYTMHTALIQGLPDDSSSAETRCGVTRPKPRSVLRRRSLNVPRYRTARAANTKETARPAERYMAGEYATVLRKEGLLRSLIVKISSRQDENARPLPTMARLARRESSLPSSGPVGMRRHDSATRRVRRRSVIESACGCSLDQNIIIKNLSLLNAERLRSSIKITRAKTAATRNARPMSMGGSRKSLFTNSLLRSRVPAELFRAEAGVARIGEEEFEESPTKVAR